MTTFEVINTIFIAMTFIISLIKLVIYIVVIFSKKRK